MNLRDHYEQVVRPTWNFSGRLKTPTDHLMNAVLGLGGEAGEIVDTIKKQQFHTERDDNRLGELELELGDLMYYYNEVLHIFDFDHHRILDLNRDKLYERHGIKV